MAARSLASRGVESIRASWKPSCFDDIPTAELLSPALTTLRVQKREMGEEAVRLLLSRIATKNRQHGIVIVPELIVRETT
ncbi:transcription regulator protein (plasmid) [Rhizobium phaseoli]|uniref:Transcription regulator protein n=1 Tax=Rhizobium phaseoli TaxID=396 RepID=A0ABM6CG26_9HYPH|nr:transcription regulator protein [Rhizobium phaseoli]ANL42799.1 transcription regulator protein [Rhizobium phaseoli]ANL55479.1 transcription regulator protein [Rhizobium phaseoli]ANL61785.1 transcription regulator protein [Rhizobium phaseoli]ANL87200.1 transcription regulator protein [Rhizobium phaseoli]